MSIQTWKVLYNSNPIAQVLTFVSGINQTKIVSKLLDGSYAIQTIGNGQKYADVVVLCSMLEKSMLDEASTHGALIEVRYLDVQYSGYIESEPSWSTVKPGEWYAASFKLLIEEVTPI